VSADLEILYEDNHLLAVNKPPGLLVQGDRSGAPTLQDLARDYLKLRYGKPGNVYLGLVHRLDRPVAGVVLLARTSKAAGRLSESFRRGEVEKVYWAVVGPPPALPEGEITAFLASAGDAGGRTRADLENFPGAREARLGFRVVESGRGLAWLEVRPLTGRRHQIRAQLALIGSPVLGDVKYGFPRRRRDRSIALLARSLVVPHPVRAEPLHLEAAPPPGWPWPPREPREESP
jgi:23S rRNA pseudouridine1911/1915/1917 synthase